MRGNQSMFLSHIDVSLPLFLSNLKKLRSVKKKGGGIGLGRPCAQGVCGLVQEGSWL